jgi:hypothetical protein
MRSKTLPTLIVLVIILVAATGRAFAASSADVAVNGTPPQHLTGGTSSTVSFKAGDIVTVKLSDPTASVDNGCAATGKISVVANADKSTYAATSTTGGTCTVKFTFPGSAVDTIAITFDASAATDSTAKYHGSETQRQVDQSGAELVAAVPAAGIILLTAGSKRLSETINPTPNLQVTGPPGPLRAGGSGAINVSEPGGNGTLSASSSNPAVATVMPVTATAPGPVSLTVSAISVGQTTITVSDAYGHSVGVQIVVTP